MILPVLLVYVVTRAFWWVTSLPWVRHTPLWSEGVIKVVLWVTPCLLALAVMRRGTWQEILDDLGLTRAAWPGVRVAAAATLPMVAIGTTSVEFRLNVDSLLSVVLLGPFAEEVLYRGFLFHQIWRRGRWPVWAAALGSAVIFALAHHKDLDEVLVALGPPMLATVAGGTLFAWLTWRWRSLWPAITLHAAVNFWWDIAGGGWNPAVAAGAQSLALLLVVAVTVWQTSGRGVSSPQASQPAG